MEKLVVCEISDGEKPNNNTSILSHTVSRYKNKAKTHSLRNKFLIAMSHTAMYGVWSNASKLVKQEQLTAQNIYVGTSIFFLHVQPSQLFKLYKKK